MRFEPREFALLGEAKGEVKLATLQNVAHQNSYVIADQARVRLIFKTPNAQMWAACLRNADAFLCPSPCAQDDASKPGRSHSRLARLMRGMSSLVKQHTLPLLWCNGIVVLALLLQGSVFFWLFVLALNLLTCWKTESDLHKPVQSATETCRSDELDFAASLHPIAVGSNAGCVEDGKAEGILVRSHGYSTHKQKEGSQEAMYELRRAFTLAAPSTSKHSHVARIGLEVLGLEAPAPSDLPTYCIVNLQIPDGAPNILQGHRSACVCNMLRVLQPVHQHPMQHITVDHDVPSRHRDRAHNEPYKAPGLQGIIAIPS